MGQTRSDEIGYKGAQSLYYAREQAERIALPLNVLITINFALTYICPTNAGAAFRRIVTNHFSKWITRPAKGRSQRPCAPTYAYWFENERDGVVFDEIGAGWPHNVHVQWYAHVPPQRWAEIERLIYQWLDYVAGEFSAAGAVKVDFVYQDNGIRPYSLKGAAPNIAKNFGAGHVQAPQGAIIGKRTGTSVNIGPTARRAADKALGIRRRRAA